MPLVTLQDVVQHSGYSIGTVSRALSGRGSVSAKAQAKIEASAKAVGYRPDPALSALSAYRRNKDKDQDLPKLEIEVVMSSRHTRERDNLDTVQGIRKQAERYGFELHFSCAEEDPETLKHIFLEAYNRTVRFVILFPDLGFPFPEADIDTSSYELIGLSSTWEASGIHVVTPNHFSNTLKACQYLWDSGVKRLGVVSRKRVEQEASFRFSAAANAHNYSHLPSDESVPPLTVDKFEFSDDFSTWLNRYQPEMILLAGHFSLEAASELTQLAGGRPFRSLYSTRSPHPYLMGSRREAVGEDAVNLVKQLMLMRLQAMPSYPVHLYVPGQELFNDGT